MTPDEIRRLIQVTNEIGIDPKGYDLHTAFYSLIVLQKATEALCKLVDEGKIEMPDEIKALKAMEPYKPQPLTREQIKKFKIVE